MSQRFDLNVEARQTGKHFSRKLRVNRRIPAVIYGATDNKSVSIDENTVIKYNTRSHENALFTIKSEDSKLNNIIALMKEVIVHPVSRRPEHVDLFALDLKKPVRVNVEIRFEGKPAGLADGGLLSVVNRQVEIECLPTEIPDSILADVSALGVGDALHLADVTIPAGVKLISTTEMTLAVVNIVEDEPVATTAAPAEGDAAAPAAGAAAPAAAPAEGDKAAAKK